MAGLMAKKLAKMQIGTAVQLTYAMGDGQLATINGTITDSDFESSIEVQDQSGESMILDFSLVKGVKEGGGAPAPGPVPTPVPAPVPAPSPVFVPASQPARQSLMEQTVWNVTNLTDKELKDAYDCAESWERKVLNSTYESFRYGIRCGEESKIVNAGRQVIQIVNREYHDNKRDWTAYAIRFCCGVMNRAHVYDSQVPLYGDCYPEAAFFAYQTGDWAKAGAYAMMALRDGELGEETEHSMWVILARSISAAGDVSAMSRFCKALPGGCEPRARELVGDLLAAKDFRLDPGQSLSDVMQPLAVLYPDGHEMEEELLYELGQQEPIPAPAPAPVPAPEPSLEHGVITRLIWMEKTGKIESESGETYNFSYGDVVEEQLSAKLGKYTSMNMNGDVNYVQFRVKGGKAVQITFDHTFIERAKSMVCDPGVEDRYAHAYWIMEKGTHIPPVRTRCMGYLIQYAMALYKQDTAENIKYLREALDICEANEDKYPKNIPAWMDLAQSYLVVKNYTKMLEYADKFITADMSDMAAGQMIPVLSGYFAMLREYHGISGDKSVVKKIMQQIKRLQEQFPGLEQNAGALDAYLHQILPSRVYAECALDLLDEAEADLIRLPSGAMRETLKAALDKKLAERKKAQALEDSEEPVGPDESEEPEEALPEEPEEDLSEDPEEEQDILGEEEILPYEDHEGWDALGLTKKEVVDYALGITGRDRIPEMLLYLRAASLLNGELEPIYRLAALAADDPMSENEYSVDALMTALGRGDSDYGTLNDYCMGAAMLRFYFTACKGYDYNVQSLRDSINASGKLSSLKEIYDLLETFSKENGCAIDIYADYRNHGVKKLHEEMEQTVRQAEEVYTKFILTPAREDVRLARLVETKNLLFDREGYMGRMLKYIMDHNAEAMEREKDRFLDTYISRGKTISDRAVNELIDEYWVLAGKNMQTKKESSTLQGNRRNNLRSNINEVLSTIYHWYVLAEKDASLTWRTEEGVAAYNKTRPRLEELLTRLCQECMSQGDAYGDPELDAGLTLLASVAREFLGHLDGSWKFNQEKYLYAGFLRSNNILLDEKFMPDLTGTFCVLPEFNVLARIRSHVEGEKLSFQERIDEIYGKEKEKNNYGTAEQICQYLQFMGREDSITLPENAEQFVSYTEKKAEQDYRNFRENYALAMSFGQIIKSDDFCYNLEKTVRYWFSVCRESRNYGFFMQVADRGQAQIHASAHQYEEQLNAELDALVASNRQHFDEKPMHEEAIRSQIADQYFTVVEDWMSRIRIGDFSLEIQSPEGLEYLRDFLKEQTSIYSLVSDASLTLSRVLGKRLIRNKDTKGGQQLIDCWPRGNSGANIQDRIEQLLSLLGWKNFKAAQYTFPASPRTEIYEVVKDRAMVGLTPHSHPIAAFGSDLEKKNAKLYVVCLYGVYDCDRMFEKIRSLDGIDGNKIILLDWALGQVDRRAIARQMKKRETGLRNVYMVIDRVLITYLANHYNESLISRMLMATTMPFTYFQPYVVESTHPMPPEIFIGRKDELLKIERPDGVNLIYGGRQLGKSALLKKAKADLDGRNHQRAILVDIKDKDCAAAAWKVSKELKELGITPEADPTDNWEELVQSIKHNLRRREDEISYFLLMLDEADTFIKDCGTCGYGPIAALKDLQQTLPGRFKYVLAGLHDIVRFNRDVALGKNSVIPQIPFAKITPFHTPEAEELLTMPLSYLGFSLPSKVTISQILATCNYFPGLIQLYAKNLVESLRAADYAGYDVKKTPPYVITDEHLRRLMADKDFVYEIHNKFDITLTLDADYPPIVLLIGWMSYEQPSSSGYTAEDILRMGKDLTVRPVMNMDKERVNALLQELYELNILRGMSNDSYLLASKNFLDLLGNFEEISDKLEALCELDRDGGTDSES